MSDTWLTLGAFANNFAPVFPGVFISSHDDPRASERGEEGFVNLDTSLLVVMEESRATSALPPSLAPRGLSRAAAAGYIGVGLTLFDEMVTDGRMPRPKRINSRVVWDRLALDAAFAALPDGEEDERAHDVWSKVAL